MRVLFIGTGEIGAPVLRSLIESDDHKLIGVVTQPDKPVGRAQRIEPTPIKAALGATDVPLFQPSRIKNAEAIEQIAAVAPDVIVVMAYGQILPPAVLEIPRIACLNLHASLLPRHRGAAPIQAAIAAGDAESGLTVMYMDEGLDTGDILLQMPLEIRPDETGGSLHDRLGSIASAALKRALDMLVAGSAPRIPQEASAATYARKLEREDGRIDWREPAELIERKIRAYHPWPGMFTLLRDKRGREQKLKIFRAEIATDTTSGPLAFRAGDSAIAIREAQLEGKRRMSAAELIRGHPWLAGAELVLNPASS
ncbi:MAG: methionyl-tRNA formyltransferase [Verrucomicrobiota bacterium]|nr:methionyl-tRNA formyltransferase [Verrucomicrobiota bacterium]